jgi:hypothetical protein
MLLMHGCQSIVIDPVAAAAAAAASAARCACPGWAMLTAPSDPILCGRTHQLLLSGPLLSAMHLMLMIFICLQCSSACSATSTALLASASACCNHLQLPAFCHVMNQLPCCDATLACRNGQLTWCWCGTLV